MNLNITDWNICELFIKFFSLTPFICCGDGVNRRRCFILIGPFGQRDVTRFEFLGLGIDLHLVVKKWCPREKQDDTNDF